MRGIVHFLLTIILLCSFQSDSAFGHGAHAAIKNSAVGIPAVTLDPGSLLGQESARNAGDDWVPPDVNAVVPPVAPGVTCSLPDVLSESGERILDLIQNVDRFTATEIIQHQGVDRSGRLRNPETNKFNYAASYSASPSGYINVEEYRKGPDSSGQSLGGVETVGMPSLILIFHPLYAKDFNMQCEGLGEWRGQPAWQIRFEQIPTAVNHLTAIIVGQKSFNVRLRGRAWILASSYQVASLQAELAEPIEQIRLRLYHQENDYGPVHFPGNQSDIWLPLSVQLYLDFSRHRFYRRHSFTNFQLFSVKARQVFSDPL